MEKTKRRNVVISNKTHLKIKLYSMLIGENIPDLIDYLINKELLESGNSSTIEEMVKKLKK